MLRNLKIYLGLIIALIAVSMQTTLALTFWVAPTGTDAPANGSESTPFRTIQYAIDRSYQFGSYDTVMVKPGTYHEQLTIAGADPLLLKSQSGPEVTTINGDLSGTCIDLSLDIGQLTVDGFTITRGLPYGIYARAKESIRELNNPEIRNCTMFQNGSSTSSSPGAGIRLEYGQPYIHHNVIKENWTQLSGAGICGIYSSPIIEQNDIQSNWSIDNFGGGIYLLGNFSIVGATVVILPASIQNNLIRWNRSKLDGAGVYLDADARPLVMNNLFYEGEVDSASFFGGGMAYLPSGRPRILNNIFVGNDQYAIDCNGASVDSTFNNCFYQNFPTDLVVGGCNLNSTNLTGVDPQFIDEAAGNYRLPRTSPLIDTGMYLSGMASADFDDGSRWVGVNPDIGPFENCLLTPDFTWTPPTPCNGQRLQTSIGITGSWDRTIWNWGDGAVDTVYLSEEFAPGKTYLAPGDYSITMTASCESDTQSITKTITVLDRPNALFVAGDTTVCINTLVTFTNNTTTANTTYLWQFGDGATSTLASPTHTYTTAALRLVRLIATNICGSDTATLNLSVIDKPNATFTAGPLFGSAPLLVNFNGSTSSPATSWLWSFGGGGNGRREDTSYTYEAPGIYSVEFSASNQCGDGVKATQSNYIRVSGFELKLTAADTVSSNFRKVYTVQTDTLFGAYGRRVNLSASILPANPRRGRATVALNKTNVAVPEQFTATVSMDSVLAAGEYQLRIIATSVANLPVDTLITTFRSNPYAIAAVAPLSIDFDSVQIDESRTDTVTVRNQLPPFPSLTVSVLNVVSSDPAFVPLVTSTTVGILPGGVFKIPVRFSPDQVIGYETTLQIQTNDPVTENFSVSLSGLGIPERKPPLVLSTSPALDAEKVLVGSSIYLDISESIDGVSLTPVPLSVRSKRLNQPIAGAFTGLNNNTRLNFVPSTKLPQYDTIDVRLSGLVRDLSGNSLDADNDSIGEGSPADDYLFRFVTGPAVFPGDCNDDGRVNELDVLPLGIFFAVQGPRRDLYSEGNSFAAKQALEWDDPRATYADANGDGVIDVTDLLVISTNWDLSHPSRAPLDYSDLDLAACAEGFRSLQPALGSFAGTDRGDKMLEIVNSLAAGAVMPNEFSLLQNFPNPFNPQTRISYALPEGVNVHVSIHNILGQTVRTLVDSYQDAGFKNVTWDGADETGRQVSSGLYFYRLEAGAFVAVRKMMKLQ
ncbi:MAG: PKD domain-containing protein [Candidatus Zixiibacteriota bacterium]